MTMTMDKPKITEGEGTLGRIYERLRKRSYRAWGGSWLGPGSHRHEAYVQGVRDALRAVAEERGEGRP